MSDRIVSWIRTIVPSLWGAVVVWLLAQWPALRYALDTLNIQLDSPAAIALVTSLAIGAWYALWRWLEPRIPDWLTRIVLGSAKAPTYAPESADGQAHVITDLPALADVQVKVESDEPTYGVAREILRAVQEGALKVDPPDDGPKHAA